MATIYKKTDRKPVLDQAEVVTRKGQSFVRLTDSKGRTRSYPVAPDGTHYLVERPSYYIDYDGPDGRRTTVKGYPDREATEAMARNLERDAARIREGLIVADRHKARTPISDVLGAYAEDLRRQARDNSYIYNQTTLTKKLTRECGWTTLASIHPTDLSSWLAKLRGQGRSPRTLNLYLETVRAFLNWCVGHRYLEANPLAQISKSDEAEKVRERRALTSEEIGRLLNLPIPAHRKRIYRFALLTGLRKDEIRALTWGDIDLEAEPPRLTMRATCNKSRRVDTLPLHLDVEALLREIRPSAADPNALVFDPIPKYETMRKDFDRAGIPHRDHRRRTADFHSLRHTYNTMLAANGVNPREAMALMRHTDIRLTTKVYVDPQHLRLADALKRLPTIGTDVSASVSANPDEDVPARPNLAQPEDAEG